MHDYLGNPVSADHSGSLSAIDDFIGGLLAYETRAERAIAAADADPHGCLINVYAGFLWMLLEAPEAPRRAVRYLSAARDAAREATRRERLNVALLEAWVAADLPAALRLCERISDEFPRDLAIVKLHQYLEFNRGDFPAMLRVALKVIERNADVPHMHGMAAFAYEQCHLLDEAQAAARTALCMLRKEPWAQHALAHVLLTRGSIDEGAQFLEGVIDTWTGLNSFMLTHLWWHLALFHLSQGREHSVLDIYDRRCWAVAKDYSQDQVGAVSLLARVELAGIEVGGRWLELGERLAARAGDTVQPFLTLQYLYGLGRAHRAEAQALLEAIRVQARDAPAFTRPVWQEVALPAGEGLYAHARGHYDTAWRRLERVLPRIGEIGGSHAQRDLFDLIALDAAVKSGRLIAAQRLLELRRVRDANGVPVNAALAQVYGQLGLAGLAAQARQRAQDTRDRFRSQDSLPLIAPRAPPG